MSQITIKPSIASGKVMVPPSKSYTHRLLIAAALSNSDVEVKNVVLSNDIKATLNCLKTLGKTIDIVDGEYNQTIKITNSNTNCNRSSNIELADELIFDCLEGEKEIIVETVKNIMENTIKISVPLQVSADFGRNWYEAK